MGSALAGVYKPPQRIPAAGIPKGFPMEMFVDRWLISIKESPDSSWEDLCISYSVNPKLFWSHL